jgi:hypothetical protein
VGSVSICRVWWAIRPLLLMSTICSTASADAWPPRCAVIAEGPSAADGASTVSLVEAGLSAQSVQLVDRQSINRVLQEQYLSKTGLIDADHAVSAGKLLSAELLAFINTSADGSSIIVFDAKTGVRLEDATTSLSGEALAQELTRLIHQAIEKGSRERNGAAAGGIKTVCLQTVRNADLPLEKSAIARAAGEILMRRLAGSPDVAVLERERLSHVTEERQLTGAEHALIASTVSLELQIARDPDRPGILVSAVLDSANHHRKASAAVRVSTENADDIAGAILPQIMQMLQVTRPKAPTDADRMAESKRFVREVMLLWSHDEIDPALDAAEAAFALNPNDFHAGAVHARAMAVEAMSLTGVGDFADPAHRHFFSFDRGDPSRPNHTQLNEARLVLALRLLRASCDALQVLEFGGSGDSNEPQSRAPATAPTTSPTASQGPIPLDQDPVAVSAEELLREFICHLRYEIFAMQRDATPMPLTVDEQVVFDGLQGDFRHLRFDLERTFARASVTDRSTLSRYEFFLDGIFEDARCAWPADGKTWTQDWAELLAEWIALEKKIGPMSATVSPKAVEDLAISHHFPQWTDRYFDYEWKMTPADWQRLVDATQGLKDLPGTEGRRVADGMIARAAPFLHPERFVAISNPPPGAPPSPLRHLLVPQQVNVQTWNGPWVGPGTAWPDSKLLADGDSHADQSGTSDQSEIEFPRVDRSTNSCYGLAFVTPRMPTERPRLDLIRFDLADGSSRRVCSYSEPIYADRPPGWRMERLALDSAELAGGYYLYCNSDEGVFLFRTSGGPVLTVDRFTADLPAKSFQAAALLDRTLYIAVGRSGHDGYLLSLDLKDRTLRTLASSRRVLATGSADQIAAPAASKITTSPFDDVSPLITWCMHADLLRDRIVMLVSNPAWPKGLSGWWEFVPRSGKFRCLAPLDMTADNDRLSPADWQSVCQKDRIAFSIRSNRASVLDLATDRITPMVPVPGAPHYSGPMYAPAGGPALGFPMVPADDWIWGRFGRYRAVQTAGCKDSVELQSFNPLTSRNTQWGLWPRYLETVDDDRVIIGDKGRLWLLHVPSDNPAAMSRLLQQPRPMYVKVEPDTRPATDSLEKR